MDTVPVGELLIAVPEHADGGDILVVTVSSENYTYKECVEMMEYLNTEFRDFYWIVVFEGTRVDRVKTNMTV